MAAVDPRIELGFQVYKFCILIGCSGDQKYVLQYISMLATSLSVSTWYIDFFNLPNVRATLAPVLYLIGSTAFVNIFVQPLVMDDQKHSEVKQATVEIPNDPLPVVTTTNSSDECVLIDRTNEGSRGIADGYELPPSLQFLYLMNNRIKKVENLETCVNLKELVLRQNAISVIEGLDTLVNVEEVDLYMNQITLVPSDAFAHNKRMLKLDLSFNQLRSISEFPSSNFPVLEELYLIGNKIKNMDPIAIPSLKLLELGDNRIRVMENLDHLPSLESLWLGRNKLEQIQNLESLVKLKSLSLQSNRITSISGIDHLHKLEELYLSHNGITVMDGIENLGNLKVLDLADNRIEHLQHLDKLTKLSDLWMNGNRLSNIAELEQLKGAHGLETIYLEGNPLARDKEYVQNVLQILPSLTQLDASNVSQIRAKAREAQ